MGTNEPLASLAALPGLFADETRMPITLDVAAPRLTITAALRDSGLLEVRLKEPRTIPVITGTRPPWGPEKRLPATVGMRPPRGHEEGACFWNYSKFGALRGRKVSNTGVFTEYLREGGFFDPPPVVSGRGYLGVQGIVLEHDRLTYGMLTLSRDADVGSLEAFLHHLGLLGAPPAYFSLPQQAYSAWRAAHETKG